jgi:hypothetical protein
LSTTHAKYFLHEKGCIEIMTVLTQNSGNLYIESPDPCRHPGLEPASRRVYDPGFRRPPRTRSGFPE